MVLQEGQLRSTPLRQTNHSGIDRAQIVPSTEVGMWNQQADVQLVPSGTGTGCTLSGSSTAAPATTTAAAAGATGATGTTYADPAASVRRRFVAFHLGARN